MSEFEPQVYLNGRYLPRSQATMDIEDRGVFFGDGVYEVVRYFNAKPFAADDHVQRLKNSLAAIRLPQELIPIAGGIKELRGISDELVRRNEMPDATVYWQVTRGSATPRDAAFPAEVCPTVLVIAYPAPSLEALGQPAGLKAILAPDVRWHNCWVKCLMLLGNVLAKNQAIERGADEAILHRDGVVTEGTATNVMIVHRGELWTHPADQWILDGVTRRVVLKLAREMGMATVERAFTTEQLLGADEVLICGTTKLVAGVTQVDGELIGRGGVGPVTKKLHRAIRAEIERGCGKVVGV